MEISEKNLIHLNEDLPGWENIDQEMVNRICEVYNQIDMLQTLKSSTEKTAALYNSGEVDYNEEIKRINDCLNSQYETLNNLLKVAKISQM